MKNLYKNVAKLLDKTYIRMPHRAPESSIEIVAMAKAVVLAVGIIRVEFSLVSACHYSMLVFTAHTGNGFKVLREIEFNGADAGNSYILALCLTFIQF